jgi:hypothetical protein
MKSFRQYLLENEFGPNGIFSPKTGYPEWANVTRAQSKNIRRAGIIRGSRNFDPRVEPYSKFADKDVPGEIRGYFGIKKSPITDETEYNGEATTFHHIGPVWNKGSGFGASDPSETPNPTFLQIKSKRVEYGNTRNFRKGLSVVISRVNHKGVADEEIHHMFVRDEDDTPADDDVSFSMKKIDPGDLIGGGRAGGHWAEEPPITGPSVEHMGLSDTFAIHPEDAEDLLQKHLDFDLPHRDTPDGPEVTIPIGAFHGQPDYM